MGESGACVEYRALAGCAACAAVISTGDACGGQVGGGASRRPRQIESAPAPHQRPPTPPQPAWLDAPTPATLSDIARLMPAHPHPQLTDRAPSATTLARVTRRPWRE